MNARQAILDRAERCKCQYPRQAFSTANLALAGDPDAGEAFIDMVCRPRPSLWSRIKTAWQALRG